MGGLRGMASEASESDSDVDRHGVPRLSEDGSFANPWRELEDPTMIHDEEPSPSAMPSSTPPRAPSRSTGGPPGSARVRVTRRERTAGAQRPERPAAPDAARRQVEAVVNRLKVADSECQLQNVAQPSPGEAGPGEAGFKCDVCEGSVPTGAKGGTEYTFKIRKDVKFHDGTPLTAHDVKATFDKIIFPPKGVPSSRKAFFMMVDSVTAPDAYTVVFTLKFPSGAFIPSVATPFNFIYSKKDLDTHGYEWHKKNVNGSGAYKFVEHIPVSYTHLPLPTNREV